MALNVFGVSEHFFSVQEAVQVVVQCGENV